MATVTGLTAERMLQIEAQTVVDGDLDAFGNLILKRHDGGTMDAGNVKVATKISPKQVADLPGTYPYNVTAFTFGAETPGWPCVLGTVFTYIENDQRGFQQVYEKGSTNVWIRTVGAAVWGNFFKMANAADLTDGTKDLTIARLRLKATNDASATSTQHAFQIGEDTGPNVIIDNNEMQARNNGVGARLYVEHGLSQNVEPVNPNDVPSKGYIDDFRRATIGQRLFSGGGIRKTTSTGISWGQRLMIMGSGRVSGSTNGYWEILMPPDGTVIPMYGSTGGASVTVAGGVIPLTFWRALYYELPLTGNQVSLPGNFRIMDYNAATTQEIPPNWVLICTRNADTLAGNYVWGDGRVQDYWKLLTLTNSWTAYNTSFPAPAWRFTSEGKVETHGLMKGGTVGLATPFATLPYPELAPDGVAPSSGMVLTTTASGGAGTCRMDILPDGRMSIISMATGGTVNPTNAYVSLDNISWHPAGH